MEGPPPSRTATAPEFALVVTGFDGFEPKPNGTRVSKLGACKVSFSGGALSVGHSGGGVGDHVTWTVEATDDAGNVGTTDCEIVLAR